MKNPATQMYRELRGLGWALLWEEEVPRFDGGGAEYCARRVALVRAVGVVFSESGRASQREAVVDWLRGLLEDPNERIRRYAMASLPKVGEREVVECALAGMARGVAGERERRLRARRWPKWRGAERWRRLMCCPPAWRRRSRRARRARPAGGF